MVKWLQKYNIQYWALSFLVASALWIYVTVMLDPEIVSTVSGIPVVFTGGDVMEDNGWALMEYQESISVTIEGRRTDLNKLKATTLTAAVSLSDVSQSGERKMFYDLVGPRELDSVKVTQAPIYVTATVERLVTREISVAYTLKVTPAESYTLESEQVSPSAVNIRGPESLVDRIAVARVSYNHDTPLTQSYERMLDYTFYDETGKVVERNGITADVDKITLKQRVLMEKELPLRFTIVEGGGLTQAMIECSFEPKSITVVGEPEFVAGLNAVNVGTLRLAGLKGDETTIPCENISANLPDGVKNVSGIESAAANVRIVGAVVRELMISSEYFELSNNLVPEGHVLRFNTSYLVVTVRGTPAAVAAVDVHNIAVLVDMPEGELNPQNYTRNAKVTINGHPEAGVVEQEYTVSITVAPVTVAEDEP